MTTGRWLVLVPLTLGLVGCNGALKPVEWSELGSQDRPSQPRETSQPRESGPPRAPNPPRRPSRKEGDVLRIVAVSSREVARLSPEDIIRIMQRVGFSNDQILELGADLHQALLLSGGAELFYGKRLEMLFAVNNKEIQIQSRTRGTFIYDIVMQRFVLGSASR
jgi:hypothetical protein